MEWNYKKLQQINGIGKETSKDIFRMFDTEQELVDALKINKVGLQNDIVAKLIEYYDDKKLNTMAEEVVEKDLFNVRCNSCNLTLPKENTYGICPHCGRIN